MAPERHNSYKYITVLCNAFSRRTHNYGSTHSSNTHRHDNNASACYDGSKLPKPVPVDACPVGSVYALTSSVARDFAWSSELRCKCLLVYFGRGARRCRSFCVSSTAGRLTFG